MESTTNDHFASRFPHHNRIDEKQASNVVHMAQVLVNNAGSLNTLSDELSRFSIKQPLPLPSPSPLSPLSVVRVKIGDPNTTTTTIPYSNVPLSVIAAESSSTVLNHNRNTNNSNKRNNSNLQNTHPNQAAADDDDEEVVAKEEEDGAKRNIVTTSNQRNGATKKIPALHPHRHRHLIPVKAQSIDICSEPSSLDGRSQDAEFAGEEAAGLKCDTSSSEPSIRGMISKIQSLDSMRPIYPNVPYSPYGSPYSSPRAYRRTTRPPLKESRRISIEQSGSFLQLNQYKLLDQIGQGSYGLVKLAYSEEDATHYAMKILSKRKLLRRAGLMGRGPKKAISPLDRVYREIAVLKKLDHPNVVKLIEVLDDPIDDSLYLVFELVKEGEVLSIPTDQPLTEERVWCIFRDVLLGLEYLHYQRIIHGDLKPGNLLLGEFGQVKIADLGVCNEFNGEDASMNNGASSGTPAFRAPETLKVGDHSYSGKAADVWALGATLYALIYGNVPFVAGNIPALYEKIKNDPIHFPPTSAHHSPELKELMLRMLEKDPDKRISLEEIKAHNWVTANQNYAMPSEEENCRLIEIGDEELSSVVTSIPKLDTLILIKTMLKKHSFQNPFQKPLPRKSQRGVQRLERFRAGRSNSAPGAYLQKQFSTETCLPSVMEGCVSESFNKEDDAIPENDSALV